MRLIILYKNVTFFELEVCFHEQFIIFVSSLIPFINTFTEAGLYIGHVDIHMSQTREKMTPLQCFHSNYALKIFLDYPNVNYVPWNPCSPSTSITVPSIVLMTIHNHRRYRSTFLLSFKSAATPYKAPDYNTTRNIMPEKSFDN